MRGVAFQKPTAACPIRWTWHARSPQCCFRFGQSAHGPWGSIGFVKLFTAGLLLAVLQVAGPPTGGIEGLVVRSGTNEPIEGVELRITPVTPQPGMDSPMPTTDRDGKFSVSELSPGRYLVMALKSGYAAQIYGSKQTGIAGLAGIGSREEDLAAAGTLINVVAGQIARNVVVRMTPSATVSGRVLGASGEPLVAMQVELLPVTFDASGRRYLIPLTQVDTDDRGEYRLFSVEPGRYYISVRWTPVSVARQEVNSELRTVDASDSNGQRYAPAYYPGSPDIAHASIIEVKAGETLAARDIVMRPPSQQPLRHVRGRVVDSTTGQAPPPNAPSSFALIPREVESLNSLPTWDPHLTPEGNFELRDVPEGAYWFVVRVTATRASAGTGRTAILPLNVAGGDVDGVTVALLPVVAVQGRATLDGAPFTSADAVDFQVRLNANRVGAFTANMAPNPSPAFFQPDGTFLIANVNPGEYELAFGGLPPDAYVQEAHLGGVDALAQRIAINGSNSGTLEIAVSTKSGQLTGVVSDRDRRPAEDVQVVVIPEGPLRRPDRYKTARTDANGQFLIRGIAPGSYRVYAWESIERFRFFDDEFVRQFDGAGRSVQVEAGFRGTANLEMIPAAR